MGDEKTFLKENLHKKISLLQDEHKEVLKIIFDDAVKNGVVKDFEYHRYLCQCMKSTEIREIANGKMSDTVLQICILDLERMGFIMNVVLNQYKECAYAISPLGLEYFK